MQIALTGAGARQGGQMRRWGQRVAGSAGTSLSKLQQALLLEESGRQLSWAAEAGREMHIRLWWSQGAVGRNALGLGARLEWAGEPVGGEKRRQWVPPRLPDSLSSPHLSRPFYCFIYTTSTKSVLESQLKCTQGANKFVG